MTTTDQNKSLIRRFCEEIDKGNISILDELVAEDYLDHNPWAEKDILSLLQQRLDLRHSIYSAKMAHLPT